jgi:hypothetical protein
MIDKLQKWKQILAGRKRFAQQLSDLSKLVELRINHNGLDNYDRPVYWHRDHAWCHLEQAIRESLKAIEYECNYAEDRVESIKDHIDAPSEEELNLLILAKEKLDNYAKISKYSNRWEKFESELKKIKKTTTQAQAI